MNIIEAIKQYKPYNEQEQSDKSLFLKAFETFEDVLSRDNEMAHMATSGFVVNKQRDKVLMVHHNIYNAWSLPGGHADGDPDLLAVTLKEVEEETGVTAVVPVMPEIFSLEMLPVIGHMRKGKYVSAHLHLSVTYLLEADETQPLKVQPDENSAVQWIPIDKVVAFSTEPHMQVVFGKMVEKVKLSVLK